MFKIKKFLIIILFILTGLYSQTRDANWILTDSKNYNALSQEAKDIISPQAESIASAFSQKISIKDLSIKSYYDCYWTYDKDRYASLLISMNNPTQNDADYIKSMISYQSCKSKTTPGFKVSDITQKHVEKDPKLSFKDSKEKSTTWEEYVKFHAGGKMDYLVIAEKGLEKKDLERYKIKQQVSQNIEFDESRENGFFLTFSWVDSDGDPVSKDILDYYNMPDSDEKIEGTFSMPELSISDIYRMVKYWKISEERKTTYQGPKIVFTMDKINKSFSAPLWKMADHKFAKEAERYASAIEAMVNDVLKNTPNVLPYMVPAKDIKAFYAYIDNDFTSVATAYINRPKKDLENLLIVMLLYLSEATYTDRTITLKQKMAEWNEVLDTQENAQELIAKGNIGNFKYTNTVKRLRSDDWSGGDDYDEYDLFSKDVIRDTGRLFTLGHLMIIYNDTSCTTDQCKRDYLKAKFSSYRKSFDGAGKKVLGIYNMVHYEKMGDKILTPLLEFGVSEDYGYLSYREYDGGAIYNVSSDGFPDISLSCFINSIGDIEKVIGCYRR